jgi:virginiamycin B lyase
MRVSATLALGIVFVSAGCSSSSSNAATQAAGCTPSPATICGTFRAVAVKDEAPYGIVFNPSGAFGGLWFTNATRTSSSAVVRFLPGKPATIPYKTPTAGSYPGSINVAPDSTLWFTETNAGKIATLDASHAVREFAIATPDSRPLDITRGPDGAMWFVESAAGKLGRIDGEGKIQEFVSGSRSSVPMSLITGPDGALWYTEAGVERIGRMTTLGKVRHYPVGPEPLSGGLTVATDDALWFPQGTKVGRLTVDGKLTQFALPSGVYKTGAIFGAKLGGVYLGAYKRNGTGAILSVSDTGAVTEFDLPRTGAMPVEMAQTADGAFWMTVATFDKGRSKSVIYELQ